LVENVSEGSLAAGVTIARWAEAEARRVYGVLAAAEANAEREELLEFVRGQRGGVTAREVHRWRPYVYRPADAAAAALLDYGCRVETVKPDGPGRPTELFVLPEG
jgi:hypothetical protein